MISMRSTVVDVVVHVPHPDAVALQIGGQILGHFLRQGGDQHPLFPLHPQVDFTDQIVDLPVGGLYGDLGVQKPRGPDDLLHHLADFSSSKSPGVALTNTAWRMWE